MIERVRAVLVTPANKLAVPLTTEALASVDLKPDAVAQFLTEALDNLGDLFALPDLRTVRDTR